MLELAQINTLQNDILNGPLASECSTYIAAGNAGAIRDAFNRQDRPVGPVPGTQYTVRGVLADLSPGVGATILDKLEAASASDSRVKWTLRILNTMNGIDLGAPQTRTTIDELVAAGVLTADEGQQLKALAERPYSRAEELFGVGVVVSLDDVWKTGVLQ